MQLTKLLATATSLLADSTYFSDFTTSLQSLIDDLWIPAIAILGSLCAIYGIFIGIKFWNARGDEGKLKEAKSAAINFAIGLVVVFIIAGLTPVVISALSTWMDSIE